MIKDRWFWFSLLAGGLILLPTLWFNLTMDQSIYAYGAWVWKHYHLPPYIGTWDQNFIGIFLLQRLALELLGETVAGFRAFDLLVQLGTLAMIYYLSVKLSGERLAGFLADIFYSIYYYGLGSLHTGQREGFVFPLLLLSVIAGVVWEKRSWRSVMLAGLALGLAFQIKPFYGLAWPLFAGWIFFQRPERLGAWAWGQAVVSGLCFLAPTLLIVLYYAQGGWLKELYRATLWYGFVIYSAWPALPITKAW